MGVAMLLMVMAMFLITMCGTMVTVFPDRNLTVTCSCWMASVCVPNVSAVLKAFVSKKLSA